MKYTLQTRSYAFDNSPAMHQNNYNLYRYLMHIQTTELVFGLLWMNKFTIKSICFHDKFPTDNVDSQVHNILGTNFFGLWRLVCFSPTLFSSNSYEVRHCMSKTGLKWLVLWPGFYKALIRSSIYFHWFMLWNWVWLILGSVKKVWKVKAIGKFICRTSFQ